MNLKASIQNFNFKHSWNTSHNQSENQFMHLNLYSLKFHNGLIMSLESHFYISFCHAFDYFFNHTMSENAGNAFTIPQLCRCCLLKSVFLASTIEVLGKWTFFTTEVSWIIISKFHHCCKKVHFSSTSNTLLVVAKKKCL